jgi:hypothetical protein
VNTVTLPLFYLPNIHYFSKLLANDNVVLNDREGFERQSYRNRCYIAGTNGLLPLIIPVQNRGTGLLTKDVKIDNTNNWQRIHWQSIRSAYGKAPYFEFYADALHIHFTQKQDLLFAFNLGLLHTLLKLTGIPAAMTSFSSTEKGETGAYGAEFIHPKKDYTLDGSFMPTRYMQTFEERLGFIPNLSIIDALFNLGPNTMEYLRKCIA